MKSPKSEAGIRRVLVHPIGVSALQNRLEAATVPLFATEQSQRLHNANFNKRWRTARERLGMEWRFHDLRHTYATLLIEQGVNSVALCAMLGHSKPSVTYDIYAGFFSDPVDTVRAQIERGRR
jgi:integrase